MIPGDIIHAGITVRGKDATTPEKAKAAAKPHLDKWQAERSAELPAGASFSLLQEKTAINGQEIAVTRYLQVVAE